MPKIKTIFKEDYCVYNGHPIMSFTYGIILFSVMSFFLITIDSFSNNNLLMILMILILTLLFLFLNKYTKIKLFNFTKIKRSDIFIILTSVALIYLSDNIVSFFYTKELANTESLTNHFGNYSLLKQIFIFSTYSVILEEIMFRGAILRLIFRNHLLIGTILSSIFFAKLHTPANIIEFLLFFSSSIIFSVVYLKTRRLEIPIIIHFLINLIGTLS
ncbi:MULTISPECIES: CPBP family intramembrane glutamic endopeptidase [Streptococcus]|uniref:CPBP family intramembrane glutamic endopeptidase n=1 Tax=Streptococcus TaxID=1301 RepID=UPI00037778AB|nr:type II CAAX endopeptidase family protein [Streptococcus didelphis]